MSAHYEHYAGRGPFRPIRRQTLLSLWLGVTPPETTVSFWAMFIAIVLVVGGNHGRHECFISRERAHT